MQNYFNPFIEELRQRLQGELPAHEAHRKVMSHRPSIKELDTHISNARQSAILILLYPHLDELHTVFIQRTNYKGVHSGQIAFPGGKKEPEDIDLEMTALREAEEEVAVRATEVVTLGKISPIYVPPSNFLINPFIGFQHQRPIFKAQPTEVADIIEAPLQSLMGENRLIDHSVKIGVGQNLKVKGFPLKDQIIWGATAMILKEFVELIEELKSPISLK